MTVFSAGTIDQQTQSLANLLPNGRLFVAKNIVGSKLRDLLIGLANEIWRAEKRIEDIEIQTDINQTTELIREWEQAVGIPDSCFTNTGLITERRNNVLAKLKAIGVSTAEEFIALAAFMGYNITITTLSTTPNPPYNVPFFPSVLPQARFVWIIKGIDIIPFTPPYNVPFNINIGSAIIPCFFNKLKPANTILLFYNTN